MILIIDNYDSFTFNLYQAFRELEEEVSVIRNDKITAKDIAELAPSLIVISPGPGTPKAAGVCLDVVEMWKGVIPIFGVCLGQEVIVEALGGRVERSPRPMHGKQSIIKTDQRTVFSTLPPEFSVTRYHSLCTPARHLSQEFEVSAISEDGVVMGVRHIKDPLEAVQFHPEAILTEHGKEVLRQSYIQALNWKGGKVYASPFSF
ncbi:anthranilate synthase component II [Salimicrobium flavidum]|uniref:Anthranilate synthase component 2/para-aminobenzoate synthetase component 2 n=1 Tax=Salimicrobium flavidum TaxID=570947 RepID=A0A1N7ITL5_9BACI|nr:aminodeoxychorismate/anthranilate synthase component II [Salimicrobium flavidum]SIS40390.1 anthranilate synthase component 2/para-aminobenzoate synthetase component 2 [Salimicrobium flavidum]